jgi:mannan endo-1,4-beta-mannosidase
MRWPNRHPHALTPGMRGAQRALARFLPLVDWARFARRPLGRSLAVRDAAGGAPLRLAAAGGPHHGGGAPVVRLAGCEAAAFACGDESQAVAYLLRADALGADGRVRRDVPPRAVTLEVPGLAAGRYAVTEWDTRAGRPARTHERAHPGGALAVEGIALDGDVALAIRRVP